MKTPVFIKKIASRLVELSIRKHVLMYLLLLCFLLIAVMTWSFTSKMFATMTQKNMEATGQLVDFVGSTLDKRLQDAMRAADLAIQQETVIEMIETCFDGAEYPMKKQLEHEREATEFLSRMEYSNDLVRIRLILQGNPIYINENIHYFRMTEEELARASVLSADIYWLKAQHFPYIYKKGRDVLSVYRPVRSTGDFNKIAGIVAVDIAMSDVAEQLENLLENSRTAVQLLNEKGENVLSLGESSLLPEGTHPFQVWQSRENESVFSYSIPLGDWGWRIVYACTREKLASESTNMLLDILSLAAALVCIACVLSIVTSFLTTRRIRRLARAIRQVKKGRMEVRVPEGAGSNELGLLERSFNSLLDTLDETVEGKIQDRMALQKAEIRLLHAQIQPHFLYNTLDLVNWRLMQSGDFKGSELVKKLARFYRLGLSHGKDQIPLKDELEHARLYVEIQAFRLGDLVDVKIDVPEEMLSLPVTGNILQPLIENAILHGIREKETGRGEILVTASQENGRLLIRVEDNGVGVDLEKINALLNATDAQQHYGLWSIEKRLKLTYGEAAGLTYSNRPEGGTAVEVRLG